RRAKRPEQGRRGRRWIRRRRRPCSYSVPSPSSFFQNRCAQQGGSPPNSSSSAPSATTGRGEGVALACVSTSSRANTRSSPLERSAWLEEQELLMAHRANVTLDPIPTG